MAYDAKVIEVMIASPGDVPEERTIVRRVITEWNTIYARTRGIVLLPISWETHSSPELSGRPQQMINDRLLKYADVLVGIFWTRIGSPSGKALSGSIEEIEEHRKQGKPVMLYFSNVPVALDKVDQSQYTQLSTFKTWAMNEGLVYPFESRDDFLAKFRTHLPLALQDNPYLQAIVSSKPAASLADASLPVRGRLVLSEDAREMLAAASNDSEGMIMKLRHVGGTTIQAGGKSFADTGDRRSVARWEAAIDDLESLGLIAPTTQDGSILQMTAKGYGFSEKET